jgi:hypothetical protein
MPSLLLHKFGQGKVLNTRQWHPGLAKHCYTMAVSTTFRWFPCWHAWHCMAAADNAQLCSLACTVDCHCISEHDLFEAFTVGILKPTMISVCMSCVISKKLSFTLQSHQGLHLQRGDFKASDVGHKRFVTTTAKADR